MKKIPVLLLICALTMPTFAEESTVQAVPSSDLKKQAASTASIAASDAKITAPLVLKDGAVSQPSQTELAGGGKATFTFKVAKAGNYVIHAVVNAPDEDANSFFLNIDGAPEDPLMIWDIEVTKGFETRVVSWRGSGDSGSDEFSPKIFMLTAGAHTLNIVGREPAYLKSISIHPAAK